MALGLGNAPAPLLIAATAAVAGPLTPTLRGKSVAVAQFVGLGLARQGEKFMPIDSARNARSRV